jgi:hypothetical protein
MARAFAESTHDIVQRVDTGEADDVSIQVEIPDCVTIQVDGASLGIYCYIDGNLVESWEETYSHDINFSGPTSSGSFNVRARLVGEIIELSFTQA